MKKLIFAMLLAACAAAFAEEKYVDPNPFSDYMLAMKSTDEAPLAVNWSMEHDAEIAAATEASVLAAQVESAESAQALLAKLKGAYETDPLALVQIAAVTQWVMTPEPCFLFFWKPSPADGRAVWTEALKRKISETGDAYVRTFCMQQLDLCK